MFHAKSSTRTKATSDFDVNDSSQGPPGPRGERGDPGRPGVQVSLRSNESPHEDSSALTDGFPFRVYQDLQVLKERRGYQAQR